MVFIPSKEINYETNNWSGILQYIRTQSGFDDPHSNNILRVSNSSYHNGNIINPITVDIDRNIYWCSKSEENSWYQISFLDNRVFIESYTYRAHYLDFFSEWEVLGSNNGFSWEVIHHKTQFLRPTNGYHTLRFTVDQILTKKVVRIVPKGTRFAGNYHFCSYGFEFFGHFISSNDIASRYNSFPIYSCILSSYISLGFLFQMISGIIMI